ncbi:hypothetical protein AK812_SmicGene1665 [Symbiodinium microadriaticum]|uniref:Uncharacterized protein n=1 Tax=Symbiodinium microadriaticum TaxID=2951 RepID=A0A1Q9F3F4_SYMMI|nr:hypothetical protein AK812_SmicGene1665 [Symbiodinium microadriaticum]
MRMSFDQGDHGQQLDDGATAIMLRRLPSKLMIESFLDILNEFWPGRYNFVYVPHNKSRERNVALAFVNFTDSQAARTAFAYFQGRSHPMDVRLGSHIRVSQADVQGLDLNLAYFIARSGLTDMENPHAPRVFEEGRRVNLLEAAKKHVTMQLVAQASQHVKAVEDVHGVKVCLVSGCTEAEPAPDKQPDREEIHRSKTCAAIIPRRFEAMCSNMSMCDKLRDRMLGATTEGMTAMWRNMYMCDKLPECMLGIRTEEMTAADRRPGYPELRKALGQIPVLAALQAIRRQDTDVVVGKVLNNFLILAWRRTKKAVLKFDR